MYIKYVNRHETIDYKEHAYLQKVRPYLARLWSLYNRSDKCRMLFKESMSDYTLGTGRSHQEKCNDSS